MADAYLRSNLREKALYIYSEAVKFADDEDLKHKIETKRDTLTTELVDGGKTDHNRMPASVK